MDFLELVNFFIGLLIICNPLSALPALLRLTHDQTIANRRRTAIVATFAVIIILLIITWIGSPFLRVLGIRIEAFQVAGGLVILLLSLAMLNAQQSRMKQTVAEETEAIDQQQSVAVIPLAMPLIAGPGAMSMIIVHTHMYTSFLSTMMYSAAVVVVSLVMGTMLFFATTLERILGKVGINIFNRLGGLLLAAIGIESIAKGLMGLFPLLVS